MSDTLVLTPMQLLITIIVTLIGSSSFWLFVAQIVDKKSSSNTLLLGLAHDRIMSLGMQYIGCQCITKDEYENLDKYLYKPYLKMGGNGSAERIMAEVNKLPIVDKPLP